MGLRPFPHRADADRRSHSRGVVADVGLRGDHVADQARPDVHGDELSQSGVSGQSRCHRRHHLGWPHPDGHRRRWYEHEWRAYGYGFPSAGVRLGRLDEGVQIMRDAWRDGKVSLDGKHYQVDGAIVAPKPLQDNGIPLWIAGGGEKVTLRIAAKYAQYTNFTGESEGFVHKSEVLAGHCRDVGTDFDAIVRSVNVNATLGTSEADVKDRLQRIRDRMIGYVPEAAADAMIASGSGPDSATGTTEQVIERLQHLRGLGCEYVICYFPEAAYDRTGIELFEREVIPALS